MIGNLNIKTKIFDFEKRVLIGWLANTVREPANQDTHIAFSFIDIQIMMMLNLFRVLNYVITQFFFRDRLSDEQVNH